MLINDVNICHVFKKKCERVFLNMKNFSVELDQRGSPVQGHAKDYPRQESSSFGFQLQSSLDQRIKSQQALNPSRIKSPFTKIFERRKRIAVFTILAANIGFGDMSVADIAAGWAFQ